MEEILRICVSLIAIGITIISIELLYEVHKEIRNGIIEVPFIKAKEENTMDSKMKMLKGMVDTFGIELSIKYIDMLNIPVTEEELQELRKYEEEKTNRFLDSFRKEQK